MDFIWAQSWGALGHDYCSSVAVDRDGEYVYVTGIFWQTVDFSGRQRGNTTERTAQGECDAFVSQFKANGIFDWVRTFDGEESESGLGVAVTRDGFIYVTGCFEGNTEFTPGGASHSFMSAGESDVFLTKLDKNGGYIWTQVIGGSARDTGWGVTADPIGGAYVVGFFEGEVDFAPIGVDTHKAKGIADIFLCSFPPDGNWSQKLELQPGMKELVKKQTG
jgi:DNA-binding beta-propeller fold protein YncE